MNWMKIDEISAQLSLPEGYRLEQLRRADIPALVAALKRWFPDVAVGSASCYLREDFYAREVYLAGEAETDVYVVVTRKDDELVAVWSCQRDRESRTLYARLGAIAPEHRGLRMTQAALALAEVAGRAMGAGLIYGMATLKVPYMQQALERMGWQLIGIVPFDVDMVAPGVVKRIFEGFYAKVLDRREDLARPDPRNLTPATRALFDALFPGGSDVMDRARSADCQSGERP